MFEDRSTEELERCLASHRATIRELKAVGKSWALDCRKMQVAQHNSHHIQVELDRRRAARD